MIVYTPRLVLREFEEGDWEAVLAYQSDPRYLRYYPWTARTAEDVRAFVAMFRGWRDESPRFRFQLAITLAPEGASASGRLIGNVGIRKPAPAASTAELGYDLNPDYWGRGYATEAAAAMLRFAFTDLTLRRVTATCIAENVASARVLTKVGMQLEGRLREHQWFRGRWWDTLLYGILRHEWHALQGTEEGTQIPLEDR